MPSHRPLSLYTAADVALRNDATLTPQSYGMANYGCSYGTCRCTFIDPTFERRIRVCVTAGSAAYPSYNPYPTMSMSANASPPQSYPSYHPDYSYGPYAQSWTYNSYAAASQQYWWGNSSASGSSAPNGSGNPLALTGSSASLSPPYQQQLPTGKWIWPSRESETVITRRKARPRVFVSDCTGDARRLLTLLIIASYCFCILAFARPLSSLVARH